VKKSLKIGQYLTKLLRHTKNVPNFWATLYTTFRCHRHSPHIAGDNTTLW